MHYLTLLFVALKLTGFITWSWWWVLSPSIFGAVLFILLLIIHSVLGVKSSKATVIKKKKGG
jgi:hypothetical protein